MSNGGNRLLMGASQRARNTSPDYYPSTYASAAYPELAASACPPHAAKRPQSVARVRSQEDRALFPAISAFKPAQLREALLNVLFIGGAVSAIIIMATILLLVPYWIFFVES